MNHTSTPGPAWREAIGFGLLALALAWLGNDRVALWDRDEPRYGGATREMIASGDYLHPTFNAEPRYHKPILTYWLMVGGYKLAGDNPFGARLVSGLMGAATCVLVWGLGRRLFGPLAGRLAGLIWATAPMMFIESKLSTTDAILTFFLVACWWLLWELEHRRSRLLAALFWASLALATLTKGPVGPGLIAVAGLAWWPLGGPRRCWRRLEWWWGVPLFLAIAAPWYIAIGVISGGEFYRVAMGYHVVRRMTTGIEEHGGFPGYYVLGAALTLLPWSAFLVPALRVAWNQRRQGPAAGFLLGWLLGPLIMFEAVQTKLIHYFYPAMPALLLLIAGLLAGLAEGRIAVGTLGRWWPAARRVVLATGIVLMLAAIVGGILLPKTLALPLLAVGSIALIAAVVTTQALARGQIALASFRLGAAWVVLLAVLGAWLLPSVSPLTIADRAGRRLAALSAEHQAHPFFSSFYQPSAVYGFGSPVPQTQSCQEIAERARDLGPQIAPLLPAEVARLRAEPSVSVVVLESIEGFNIVKGRRERLELTLIQSRPRDLARRPNRSSRS